MKKEKEKKKKHDRAANPEPPVSTPSFEEKETADWMQESAGNSIQFLSRALTDLGGKWRLQVLWALREGSGMRYGSIKSAVPGITDMMLSQSLRELCQSGLAERRQFREMPPRVEYCILPDGASLIPVLWQLVQWQQKREQCEKEG